MRSTCWPPEKIPADVREAQRAHPDVLLIWHPEFKCYQLYKANDGRWDAKRLYDAICSHNWRGRDPEWKWWLWRGAPRLLESNIHHVGSWLPAYLDKIDDFKHPYPGGYQQWLRDFEIQQEADYEKKRARRDEFTRDRLREGALHLRDVHRGDTIWRKWVQNSPASFRGGKVVR